MPPADFQSAAKVEGVAHQQWQGQLEGDDPLARNVLIVRVIRTNCRAWA